MKKLTQEEYEQLQSKIYQRKTINIPILSGLLDLNTGERLFVSDNETDFKQQADYKEKTLRLHGWRNNLQAKSGRFFKFEKLIDESGWIFTRTK
jgi:hypothetical protein